MNTQAATPEEFRAPRSRKWADVVQRILFGPWHTYQPTYTAHDSMTFTETEKRRAMFRRRAGDQVTVSLFIIGTVSGSAGAWIWMSLPSKAKVGIGDQRFAAILFDGTNYLPGLVSITAGGTQVAFYLTSPTGFVNWPTGTGREVCATFTYIAEPE